MPGFADIRLPDAVARGVIKGERAALADAYALLAQAVMNLAARILQDHAQAEEVLQDTFIDLVEKSAQINNTDSVVAWVRRVAVNHCLMRLRSPWHARRAHVDAHFVVDDSQADHSMQWIEQVPTLEQALASLSDDARLVVWLHDVEGFTHKEIGELVGKTTSYSKSQLARAYERLLLWHQQQQEQQDQQEQPPRKSVPTATASGGGERHQQQLSQDETDGQKAHTDIGSPCAS